MARGWVAGAYSYGVFFLIVAHPFLNIKSLDDTMNAQEITNLLTAALAVATVWLGAETRKMAVAAKASIELEARPYLSFRGFYVKIGTLQELSSQNTGALRIGLRLFNPGKVLVTYKVESMLVSINSTTTANPTFDTTGSVIHPAEETLFFYPVIGSLSPLKAPATLEILYRIAYWTVPADKKVLTAKVRLLLTSETDHEWIYLEGPHYA